MFSKPTFACLTKLMATLLAVVLLTAFNARENPFLKSVRGHQTKYGSFKTVCSDIVIYANIERKKSDKTIKKNVEIQRCKKLLNAALFSKKREKTNFTTILSKYKNTHNVVKFISKNVVDKNFDDTIDLILNPHQIIKLRKVDASKQKNLLFLANAGFFYLETLNATALSRVVRNEQFRASLPVYAFMLEAGLHIELAKVVEDTTVFSLSQSTLDSLNEFKRRLIDKKSVSIDALAMALQICSLRNKFSNAIKTDCKRIEELVFSSMMQRFRSSDLKAADRATIIEAISLAAIWSSRSKKYWRFFSTLVSAITDFEQINVNGSVDFNFVWALGIAWKTNKNDKYHKMAMRNLNQAIREAGFGGVDFAYANALASKLVFISEFGCAGLGHGCNKKALVEFNKVVQKVKIVGKLPSPIDLHLFGLNLQK